MYMLEIHLLLLFMIAAAVIAVRVKDLLSSVVAVGAAGLGLSMSFLVLKAPDLAITQLVVEILCLVILIRATIKKDLPFSASGRWFFNTLVTLCFLAVFLAAAYFSLKDLPQFGYPTMRVAASYLENGVAQTGSPNIISAIILDYRGYDTLGEATVLFTAMIGVLAIIRKIGRRKQDKR